MILRFRFRARTYIYIHIFKTNKIQRFQVLRCGYHALRALYGPDVGVDVNVRVNVDVDGYLYKIRFDFTAVLLLFCCEVFGELFILPFKLFVFFNYFP